MIVRMNNHNSDNEIKSMLQHKNSSKNKINEIDRFRRSTRNDSSIINQNETAPHLNRTKDKISIVTHFYNLYDKNLDSINTTSISIKDWILSLVSNYYYKIIILIIVIAISLSLLSYQYSYILSNDEDPFTYDFMNNINTIKDSVNNLKLSVVNRDYYLSKNELQLDEIRTTDDILSKDNLLLYFKMFLFFIVDAFVTSLFLISLATAVTSDLKKRQLAYMVARLLIRIPRFNNITLWIMGPLLGRLVMNLMTGMSELDALHPLLNEISDYFHNKRNNHSGDDSSSIPVYSHRTITTQLPYSSDGSNDLSGLPDLVSDDSVKREMPSCASNSSIKLVSEIDSTESHQVNTTSIDTTEHTSNVNNTIGSVSIEPSQQDNSSSNEVGENNLPSSEKQRSYSKLVLNTILTVTIVTLNYIVRQL